MSYQPPRTMSNTHVQSILATSGLRRALVRRRGRTMLARTRTEVITVLDGIRLSAEITNCDNPRAAAVLFHGWEGQANSNYVTELASRLHHLDVAVVRLNFRDHGNTAHLNEGIFHSCRIDEVVAATEHFADRWSVPFFIAGYSLGGNFALRVGLRAQSPIQHIYSVSPLINPAAGLDAIENAPFVYQKYFMRKWLRSIRTKCEMFPDRYQWDPQFAQSRLRELTAWLVERYTRFGSLDEYLDGYSLTGSRLSSMRCAATLITAADDPVIPVADFRALELAANTNLITTAHGGHCGFLDGWRLSSWTARQIAQDIAAQLDATQPSERSCGDPTLT